MNPEGASKFRGIGRMSPQGLIDFYERLASGSEIPEFLSDHPNSKSRADLGRGFQVLEPEPMILKSQWESLKRICDR